MMTSLTIFFYCFFFFFLKKKKKKKKKKEEKKRKKHTHRGKIGEAQLGKNKRAQPDAFRNALPRYVEASMITYM
jgi:hypothetical protein